MHFYFYLRARSLWSMLGVDFNFPSNLFYFRSSTILVESPSTTDFNNFFSLFCTTSSRPLSVLDYGSLPNVSKNCRCCVVGSQSLKKSPTVIAVWNIFNNSKWIENQFFYKFLFKSLVSWLIYQKLSMLGRNRISISFWKSYFSVFFIFFYFRTLQFDVWRHRLDNTFTRFRVYVWLLHLTLQLKNQLFQ